MGVLVYTLVWLSKQLSTILVITQVHVVTYEFQYAIKIRRILPTFCIEVVESEATSFEQHTYACHTAISSHRKRKVMS